MNYEMTITLKSDLCSASGDGFSLSIDTDVCSDELGFPIIPSRRLKGCMLKAAKYIGAENIDEIFGETGSKKGGSLKIGNAVLRNYESLREEARCSGKNAQQILSLFTSVRASTAIENDTAKKDSLRFTRVVNHYSPFGDGELTFIAPIEADKQYRAQLKNICKATRNIGYKRNRGFGAVRCSIKEVTNPDSPLEIRGDISDDEKSYEIRYSIYANSPIMLAGANSTESEDYIRGTLVMGFFTGKYLEDHSPDVDFEDIFLKNNVIFSDMHIISGNGTLAFSAPSAIGKDKTADKACYKSLLGDRDPNKILKPLKGGYFADEMEVKVKTETVYHHSDGEDGTLYTQTCISAGQAFGGTITGKGKYLRNILDIIRSGKIALGRSKTAQYADCAIISAEIVETVNNLTEYTKGEKIAAVFCSDALFLDECGNYTTEFDEVCEQLGIAEPIHAKSFMKYKTVMGYMSVGGYKKPHIRAIKAGSTVCFSADRTMHLPKYDFFGEKNGEGFGRVCFIHANNILKLDDISFANKKTTPDSDGRLCRLLDKNALRETVRNEAIQYAKDNRKSLIDLTSSFIGRVHLMVRQAGDYTDLHKRIDTIKTDSKKSAARKIADTAEKYKENGLWREYLEIVLLLAKYFNREAE